MEFPDISGTAAGNSFLGISAAIDIRHKKLKMKLK